MSGINILNLLFLVLMYKVSSKKDAVFWVLPVCVVPVEIYQSVRSTCCLHVRHGGDWLLQSVAKFSLPKMAALITTSFLHSQPHENLKSH